MTAGTQCCKYCYCFTLCSLLKSHVSVCVEVEVLRAEGVVCCTGTQSKIEKKHGVIMAWV